MGISDDIMTKSFRNLFFTIFEFFLPRLCLFCNEPVPVEAPTAVCPGCAELIEPVASPLCPRCGRMFAAREGSDHLCGFCQKEPPPYARAQAAVVYEEDGPAGLAIKRLKYAGRREYLPVLQHWLQDSPCRELAREADLLVPVPLHPKRLRQRGFNQALLLAQAFPEVPLDRDNLRRVRATVPQVGLKSLKERRANVKGAFAVARPEKIAGKNVCLVDDVFTTGATVRECARALNKAGARSVTIITAARVRYD
jgi:ComF family protein